MNFTKLLTAGAVALCFTSCLDHKNNDLKFTMTYTNFLNYVQDLSTGEPFYSTGSAYQLTYNMSQATADLAMQSLTLPSGVTYTTLNFNNVPWSTNTMGWKNIYISNMTPESTLLAPDFSDVVFNVLDRYVLTNTYYPCLDIRYRIGDTYQIYSYPSALVNVGTTNYYNEKTGESYTPTSSEEGAYVIELFNTTTSTNLNKVESRKATINMYGVKFNNSYEAVNLVIKEIPFDCLGSTISFSKESSQVYQFTGTGSSTVTEFGDFQVRNLICNSDASNNMVLSFVISSEKEGVSYQVTARSSAPN